jgi:hypothetical protein
MRVMGLIPGFYSDQVMFRFIWEVYNRPVFEV